MNGYGLYINGKWVDSLSGQIIQTTNPATGEILADHHVIRHLCDLEALSTLEGTESVHTLLLGQDVRGIPAFS